MEITTELVNHLAELSRLEFNEQETENFKHEFAQTLEHMNKLNVVNTTDVQPQQRVLDASLQLDDDIAKAGLTRAEATENAPDKLGASIAVPMMVD